MFWMHAERTRACLPSCTGAGKTRTLAATGTLPAAQPKNLKPGSMIDLIPNPTPVVTLARRADASPRQRSHSRNTLALRPTLNLTYQLTRILARPYLRGGRGRLPRGAALEVEAGQVVNRGRALRGDAHVQRLEPRVQRTHKERKRGCVAARDHLRAEPCRRESRSCFRVTASSASSTELEGPGHEPQLMQTEL